MCLPWPSESFSGVNRSALGTFMGNRGRFGKYGEIKRQNRLRNSGRGDVRCPGGKGTTVRPGFPVAYTFKGYGSHVAGVAVDGKRLLMTASAYGGKTPYNDRGLLFAADPAAGDVTDVWSLGDYSCDPRGVAVRNGLVYVCDGYTTAKLPDGMGPNRQGLKLYVFALGPVTDLSAYQQRLLLRQRTRAAAPGSRPVR